VCEQLGWNAPDTFITPVGNGTLLLGAALGFQELLRAGIIQKTPRIFAVQAAPCAPCAEAFFQGKNSVSQIDKKETIAEGIAVAEPVRGAQIIKAVRDSGGDFVTVEDHEIIKWLKKLYNKGFYIEPTSAAVFAGIAHSKHQLHQQQTIVSVITGHGLKANKAI
jgi:threonine synthase